MWFPPFLPLALHTVPHTPQPSKAKEELFDSITPSLTREHWMLLGMTAIITVILPMRHIVPREKLALRPT